MSLGIYPPMIVRECCGGKPPIDMNFSLVKLITQYRLAPGSFKNKLK